MTRSSLRRIALLRAARDHARAALYVLAVTLVVAMPPARPTAPTGVSVPVLAAHDRTRSAVRTHPSNFDELALVQSHALDVWTEHVLADETVLDIVVDGEGLAALDAAGIAYTPLVDDIDAVATAEHERLRAPEAQRPGDWFAEYHDFTAIQSRLELLAAEQPELVELSSIGGSVEGRPLLALHIGGRDADAVPMLINGAQHAREWISTMVPICVADRLTAGYASDPELKAFVDSTDLWVVPVVNPDGYQYSWSSDRYWRKNRRGGHGIDLNRNFEVAFGGSGSSSDKRSQIYRGPYPFSEPETAALRDLVRREHIAVHVDFHAYGQLLLHPWNHTAAPSPGRDRFAAIGDKLASAIHAQHGMRYDIRAGAQLYPAAGTMTDWMYGEGATSFTIELRPKGGSGFVLPPAQIKPTCDEAFAAVLELRKAVSLRPRSNDAR